MQTPAGTTDPLPQALAAALFEYHRRPGRYQVTLRQPALLFASVKDVLQLLIAYERAPPSTVQSQVTAVADAARFFVRTALLQPAADHYALLGLHRGADDSALKDRYRLMMRLLHPDVSIGRSEWPADAAVRLNLAYATLSSPAKRRDYDASFQVPVPPLRHPVQIGPRLAEARAGKTHGRGRRIALAGSLGISLGLTGFLFLSTPPDVAQLVQRAAQTADSHLSATAVLASALQQTDETMLQSTSPPAGVQLASAAPPKVFSDSAHLFKESMDPVGAVAPANAGSSVAQDAPSKSTRTAAQASPSLVTPPIPNAREISVDEANVRVATAPTLKAAPPLVRQSEPSRPRPAPQLPTSTEPTFVALSRPVVPAPHPAPVPLSAQTTGTSVSPGLTLIDAHPLLARLLQEMESGSGERMVNVLEPVARASTSAQAVMRHYNSLIDGARTVSLSHVQFKAEPREGRLLVTGSVLLRTGDQPENAGKEFSVEAEFALREGSVVMTRLARAQN